MGGCKIKYKKKNFKTSGRKYRETYNLGIRKKYFNQVTQSTNYKQVSQNTLTFKCYGALKP